MYKHLTPLDRVRNAVLYELHAVSAALEANPVDPGLIDAAKAYETCLHLIDRELMT